LILIELFEPTINNNYYLNICFYVTQYEFHFLNFVPHVVYVILKYPQIATLIHALGWILSRDSTLRRGPGVYAKSLINKLNRLAARTVTNLLCGLQPCEKVATVCAS